MIIIGIDPGTATTGVGVLEGTRQKGFKCLDYGCILTSKTLKDEERLAQIHRELDEKIKRYRPDLLAIETLFFNKNPKTAMSVARASGVVLLTANLNLIPITEVTPSQVKMAIGGHGRAEKQQIQKMITTLLKLKETPKPDDAADALAIALTAGVIYKSMRIGSLPKSPKQSK